MLYLQMYLFLLFV